jgi:hypothetical protein
VKQVFGIMRLAFMLAVIVMIAAAVSAMVSGSMAMSKKMMHKVREEMGEKGEGIKKKMFSMGDKACEDLKEVEAASE